MYGDDLGWPPRHMWVSGLVRLYFSAACCEQVQVNLAVISLSQKRSDRTRTAHIAGAEGPGLFAGLGADKWHEGTKSVRA